MNFNMTTERAPDERAGLQQRRTHLKHMLRIARSLPEGAQGKPGTIEKIEVELLYLKLYLNVAY